MAQLKKLMIQGIRSFDPDTNSQQTIEFYSPLTLIVGQNGCGKTTIIEALKFAITSEYPPGTSKSGSFVHDPKLSSGYEVPAMVKLELKDKNGDRIVMTRRLKAVQKGKAGNISTSSVEASIRRAPRNGGAIQDISGKCADVKEEMCRLMGVSEAILNNVIFCHQEDSCWPLDEGKKVKEKFDAIFNTTMYMKALERLSKKEKDMMSEIKVFDERFKYSQVITKEFKSKQSQIEKLNAELQAANDQINRIETEAQELDKQLEVFVKIEQEFSQVEAEVKCLKQAIDQGEQFIKEQTDIIKKVEEGSIADLSRAIANFKVSSKQTEQRLDAAQTSYEEMMDELGTLRKQKEQIIQEEGKFAKAEQDNNKTKASVKGITEGISCSIQAMKENSQDSVFVSSASSFLEAETSDESVKPENTIRIVSSAIRSKETELTRIKSDFEAQEKDLDEKINKLRESKASMEKEIQMKQNEIQRSNKAITEAKEALRRIEGSGEALDALNNQIEDISEKIANAESSGILKKYNQEIDALQIDIKELRKKSEELKGEVDILRADKVITDQIQYNSKSKEQKENDCKEILKKCKSEFEVVLEGFPAGELTGPIQGKIKTLRTEIVELERKQKLQIQTLSSKEAQLKHAEGEITKKECIIEEWKAKADDILEGDAESFEEIFNTNCEDLEQARRDSHYNDASQHIYRKYIARIRSKPCCPMCRRDFRNKPESEDVVRSLEEEIAALNQSKPTDQAKVEKIQERNAVLIQLKKGFDQAEELRKIEIPQLKLRITALKTEIDTSKEAVEGLNSSIEVLKDEFEMANNLASRATLYDQGQKEILKYEKIIKSLEAKRDPRAKECSMTLSEADDTYQFQEQQLASKLQDKEQKETFRKKKITEVEKLKEKKLDLETQKLEINTELQNRDAFEKTKRDMETQVKSLQSTIDELKSKLPATQTDMNKLSTIKTTTRQEKEEKLSAIRNEKFTLEKQRDLLRNLKKQLEEFDEYREEFIQKQKNFTIIKSKLSDAEAELEEVSRELERLKEELSTNKLRHQALTISLSIRQKEKELEKNLSEIAGKQKALEATRNRGVVGPEKRQLLTKMNELTSQKNRLEGARNEKKNTLQGLNRELVSKDKPYHNAEAQYMENLINKVVHEKARKDVAIYKAALEAAVLNFHQKKMETINRYLQFFWKKVYRGNDIEYIQIRTDNDDANKSNDNVKIDISKTRRRTYNYRVVMIRRGIELDMRGRCSAGQKILAAIIIRLALAQTFSARCGIISLDEPTTNLDKKNIDSLAETLSDLALDMKDMKTFQLIVITHDQDFIDKLLHVDPVEFYFRVTRNQNGYSKVDRTAK